MRLFLNILWLIFGGLVAAIAWFILGVLAIITIIGIPLGLRLFKFARLMLSPFGKEVQTNFEKHPILNVIWLIFFGWELALSYLSIGLVLMITIIGIPFGLQWFKFTKLALLPVGAKIVTI